MRPWVKKTVLAGVVAWLCLMLVVPFLGFEQRIELVSAFDSDAARLLDANASLAEIQAAFGKGRLPVDAQVTYGRQSLLNMAIWRERADVVRWLLEIGADPNQLTPGLELVGEKEPSMRTALTDCVHNKGVEVAQILMRAGADPDLAGTGWGAGSARDAARTMKRADLLAVFDLGRGQEVGTGEAGGN